MELKEKEKTNQALHQKLMETEENNILIFLEVIKEYMWEQNNGFFNNRDGFDTKYYNMKKLESIFREKGIQGLLDTWVLFGEFPEWYNEMMYDKRP